MKILSRISISPMAEEYPYSAPDDIERQAKDLYSKHSKYCINLDMMLLLVPIDEEPYREIKLFMKTNAKYFKSEFELFEREYSKKELEDAKFYSLRIANVVYTCNIKDDFKYCCDKKCFLVSQEKDMFIEAKSFKNKHLGFTTNYRFIVSPELKKAF